MTKHINGWRLNMSENVRDAANAPEDEQPRIIKVTERDIRMAKLAIRLSKFSGDPVPPHIVQIANMKPKVTPYDPNVIYEVA